MSSRIPPVRTGVSASCVYLPKTLAATYPTFFDFFTQTFTRIQASDWLERFEQGLILDGQGQAVLAQATYCGGQHLFYYRHVTKEIPIPFEATVIYQDEHLVVADKPHFLPVTPSGRYLQETLLLRLKKSLNLSELSPLHRLDQGTAGLVLFGVRAKERGAYQQMFQSGQIHKTYEAIAPYRAELNFPQKYESRLENSACYMQMHEVAGQPNSCTQIAVAQRLTQSYPGVTLARYRLNPITGKRHQLRVHMNALGIPILHDGIYPQLTPERPPMSEPDYSKPLQLLAKRLEFVDPITRCAHQFESQRQLKYF